MYKAGFNRMKDIDKNLMNKNKTFFNDCIEAKYRVSYTKSPKKKKIK